MMTRHREPNEKHNFCVKIIILKRFNVSLFLSLSVCVWMCLNVLFRFQFAFVVVFFCFAFECLFQLLRLLCIRGWHSAALSYAICCLAFAAVQQLAVGFGFLCAVSALFLLPSSLSLLSVRFCHCHHLLCILS